MSKRFGGTYSPDGADRTTGTGQKTPLRGKQPARNGARSNLLFIASLPLLWKAFGAEPIVMAGYMGALFCLVAGAYMTREGLKAEDAYEARKVARRPAIPRKIFGAVLTGAGLGLVGWFGWGQIEAPLFAVMGTLLHLFSFGLDPLKNKGMDDIDSFQQSRVATAVKTAQAHLDAMQSSLARLSDRKITARFNAFRASAENMCRIVEEDPRDLTPARKYLGVYLEGARDATRKFADLYARGDSEDARSRWFDLLDDLETNFNKRNDALLLDNQTDLDIEIDVLKDRLKREGV